MRLVNRQKSELIEYNRLVAAPHNQHDSTALAAVQDWLFADREIINPELFARATKPVSAGVFLQTLPDKLVVLVKTFARDYFLLIFIQVMLLIQVFKPDSALPNKKLFAVWQFLFWVSLVAMGIWLKLPPRVATACLSVHLLAAMGTSARFTPLSYFLNKWALAVLLVLGGLQLYKIAHRVKWQQNTQIQHEQFLAIIPQALNGKTIIVAQLGEQMGSLSPFKNYSFGNNRFLRITGWPVLLPFYSQQLIELSGTENFADALLILSTRPETVWLLPDHFPALLQRYFRVIYHTELSLERQTGFPAGLQQQGYGVYRIRAAAK